MVRNYKKKNTRCTTVNENDMVQAIKDVLEGKLSYRKAADKHNVKASTLESRVKKIKNKSDEVGPNHTYQSKFTSYQVFSNDEESELIEYIEESSKMHFGLTLLQVRALAYQYAKALKRKYPPKWDETGLAGIDWIHGFRKRNNRLSLRKPENTSAARAFGFNKTVVNEFFDNLKTVYERHRFTADRIFNFDESGISTVLDTPKVLAAKTQRQVGQIVSAERGELVTFGGIISASGNTIPPLFVFPRVHYKDHFMEGAPEGSLGTTNRTGWINSEIFVEVLKHIQKHTLSTKENPILLLCDNHESHISLAAINYARDNGIIYLSFPPHTSHKLQPLDVAVFGPFKSKLKTAFNDWHVTNPGKTVTIYNIPKIAKLAYFEAFTAKNITSAFSSPGIWPFNQLAFSDEDFAPIKVYTSGNSSITDQQMQEPQASSNELQQNVHTEAATTPQTPPQVTSETPELQVRSTPEIEVTQKTPPRAHEVQSVASGSQENPSPITPAIIRPYPTAEKKKKAVKGRQPGKSRIYTDTPEKNRLEDLHNAKQLKKIEQERKAQAREIKRTLKLTAQSKPKKAKKKKEESSDSESEKSEVSLQESSTSVLDSSSDENIGEDAAVLPETIKDNCFILVKFAKKKSIVYYVAKVINHYSERELKVSYLRKKPGLSWSFVFPNIADEHSVDISDVALILPDPKSPGASTARTSRLYTFPIDMTRFNVQ
jgi:transposase-like protein